MPVKNISEKLTENLIVSCRKYFETYLSGTSFPEEVDVTFQITRDVKHGDLTTNVAMRLASFAKKPPNIIAEEIKELLKKEFDATGASGLISSVEIKGGFINLRLSDEYYKTILKTITSCRESFGRSDDGAGRKVNIEYVSANPTGPLTIAHGRQAAIGDALSRILKFSGFEVTGEYYLNDFGRQISMLGKSVEIRYRNIFGIDEEMPEDGYMGDYIKGIAEDIKREKKDTLLEKTGMNEKYFRDYAVNHIMGLIRKDLEDFGVDFDVWTSQAAIEGKKAVEKVLGTLEDNGYIYNEDGAKWFASTKFEDDKDRVVVKSDGSYTYLAPDIAYHKDKYSRGYSKLIDLLGPDHHGYINRMKAAVQALGYEKDSLDILIVQLVTLMRGGNTLSMSTRKGEFISLRELLDELGKDVTRFFFLSRRLDSHLDFDIDLAKKESADNPVFYMQYAHARICSIKRYSRKNRLRLIFTKTDTALLSSKEEHQLIRKLSEFPSAVKSSSDALEPNRLVVYLNELSRSFHSFYTECRVVSDDIALSKARLFLVECVRIVLANGLGLLNITLPEKM